ncbi:uncharacterized protein [Montipora capricornis]|uniref:uncharacterized protein isoform X1 n=1 Tax=Montipora capricornis TaxID=246305 RepID=UPI0035F16162
MEEFMIMLEALVLMTFVPCLRTSGNVQWPGGTYGIPKPADGCPSVEAFRWQQGWRCQYSNGHKDSKNAKSLAFHVDAVVDGEKVNRSFCMKTHAASDGNRLVWPPGQYCIYKYQRCPDGLTEGFVLWDDHDKRHENDKGGTLPNGTYNHNTKIEFCCRTDGDKSHPILLPTRAPFYLLAYGSEQCQMVKWAIATQEWIYYDTEKLRNLDEANGTYPYRGGEKHPTIYYCYYQACSVNLTGAIGTFNSRMDADIHYCSWRITVSPVLQIIIKFTNFSLQNAGNDSLLVYDGEDASKKVLGVFYNGQLPPKKGISSTSNHMFVVFKSNNHTKDSGFFASYYTFNKSPCSVNLTGAIGTFNSRMDADIHYCSWRITVSPVLQIIIKFTNFSLQNAGNDSLLVYDGEDASKKVLGVFYNGQPPPKEGISSTSNHMFVVFKSNNHTKDSGFFASYYTFNKSLHPTSASSGSSVTAKATSQSLTQSSHSHTERKANEGGQSKKAMVYGPVIGVLLVALIVLVVYTVWIRKRKGDYSKLQHGWFALFTDLLQNRPHCIPIAVELKEEIT